MARSSSDYTKRTSSGTKLAAIIAQDLQKRATKKQHDTNKTAAPRKGGSKSDRQNANHETQKQETSKHEISKLDIRVPDKNLTDDGFDILATGLADALEQCHDLAFVDLDVSNNNLTTRSLARLAPIIGRAYFDLQTLNLSGNDIQVQTAEQARDWETFLRALSTCRTLRRLDLSNNTSLGNLALEILARTYIRERPIDPLPAEGVKSVVSLPETPWVERLTMQDSDDPSQTIDYNGRPESPMGDDMAQACYLDYRCGLRSLPYLTLQNTGLTDTGALFLSFILEQHYYPVQLINSANAAEPSSQIRIYRQDANSGGIDYEKNGQTLGKDGLQLLQKVEKVRTRLLSDGDGMTSFLMEDYEDVRHSQVQGLGSEREVSVSQRRRASTLSSHSTDGGIELERARRKVQRTTILHHGYANVELWRAAMTVLGISRHTAMLVPSKRTTPITVAQHTLSEAQSQNGAVDIYQRTYDMSKTITSRMSELSLENISSKKGKSGFRPSYAATLCAASSTLAPERDCAITDVTNAPKIPTVGRRTNVLSESRARSTNSCRDQTSVDNKHKLTGSIGSADSSQRYLDWQHRYSHEKQALHDGASDGYRDASLRCHLPLPICLQILQNVMGPDQLSLLSERQQKKAFEWGQLKDSLLTEHDWRNKDKSSQIWMLLEALECLVYE